MQLQRQVLHSHIGHTKDVASLERKTKSNSDKIDHVTEIVKNDMRTLQNELQELKQQVAVQKHESESLNRIRIADQDVTPPQDFMENFSKEYIAQAYLDEAEDYEKTASKLREQAEGLCSGMRRRKLPTLRLLDGLNGTEECKSPAEFACCRSTFSTIEAMLEHISDAHGMRSNMGNSLDDEFESGDTTPTHMPARRPRTEKLGDLTAANENTTKKVETGSSEQEASVTEQISFTESNTRTQIQEPKTTPEAAQSTTLKAEIRWQPLGVRNMPSLPPPPTNVNTESFTWEFLISNLGGHQWSPGYYFIPHDNGVLPSKGYWILEAETEPYIPLSPGDHGAKLTAFFNDTVSGAGEGPDETNYIKTPVFICPDGGNEYIYYGNYSQLRFSDKLDYDRVMAVPEKVRRYWANQLTSVDRPEWVTRSLMNHFWPKPIYSGRIPTDSALNTPATEETSKTDVSDVVLEKRVQRDLKDYALELKDWGKEARMKVSHLTSENIMGAFEKADADEEAGLRLWWEYLQFDGYDQGFYEFLVRLKYNPNLQTKQAEWDMGDGRRVDIGRKMVKGAGSVETVRGSAVPPASAATPEAQQSIAKSAPHVIGGRTGSRPHTGGVKPWVTEDDKTKTGAVKESKMSDGDLELAKQLQKDFQKGGVRKHGGNGGEKKGEVYTPPYARGRK